MNPRRILHRAALLAAFLFQVGCGGGEADWTIINDKPTGDVVVAFGDSLTYGQGASDNDTYPEHLARLIGKPVVNAGVNGDTTEDGLRRVGRVLAQKPAVVIITLGGNDVLQGVPVEKTVSNLGRIFEKLHDAGALIVYGAVKPPLVSGSRTEAVRELCRERGVLYVDSIMQGLWGDSEKMSDQIHPNGQGYKVLAERIHKRLAEHYE